MVTTISSIVKTDTADTYYYSTVVRTRDKKKHDTCAQIELSSVYDDRSVTE
jgi:hypothetical protein